jgi:hypothetical protein
MSEPITDELSTGETEPQAAVTDDEPEVENPDAEPPEALEEIEPPAEPAAEPAAPQGMSDKEREEQQKKLDREAKRHTNTIRALLGDEEADVTECPFCDPQLQGFFFDAQLATPRSEMQAAMIGALSQPLQADYRAAPHAHRCEDCDGYGVVQSGSRKPGNETIPCPTCKALGYVTDPRFPANGNVSAGEAGQLVAVGAPEPVIEDADAWGSPRLMADGQENPNYGRMPQYKNPDLP